MLDIRKCPGCWEIKKTDEFEPVKTGEDFIASMSKDGIVWRLQTFEELLCKDCISRMLLNEE